MTGFAVCGLSAFRRLEKTSCHLDVGQVDGHVGCLARIRGTIAIF